MTKALERPRIICGGMLLCACLYLGAPLKAASPTLPPSPEDADVCRVVAEISVEAVHDGAMAVCLKSKNKVACAVVAATSSVALKGVLEKGVEAGCRWMVRKTGSRLEITIEAAPANRNVVQAAQKELSVRQLRWTSRP